MVNKEVNFFKVEFNFNSTSSDADYYPDITSTFQKINSLMTSDNIYMQRADGDRVFIIVDTPIRDIRNESKYIRGRLILSRKDILPPLEQRGRLSDLNIPADAGIAEISHFVLFQHENQFYLAMELNKYGTHINSWSKYIKEKCEGFIRSVKAKVLITNEFLALLEQEDSIDLVKISIKKNNLSRLSSLNDNIKRAFNAAARVDEDVNGTIGLHLTFKEGLSFFKLFSAEKREVKTLLTEEEFRQIFSTFSIVTEDGHEINLRKFKYAPVFDVEKRGNKINSNDFHTKIERHIDRNTREIIEAHEL